MLLTINFYRNIILRKAFSNEKITTLKFLKIKVGNPSAIFYAKFNFLQIRKIYFWFKSILNRHYLSCFLYGYWKIHKKEIKFLVP